MSLSARTRRTLVVGAVTSLVVLVALGLLVQLDLGPLDRIDNRLGTWPESVAYHHPAFVQALVVIEKMFSTISWTVVTVVVAGVLALRGYWRAGVFAAGTMLLAGLSTWFLKGIVGRSRPDWPDPVHTLSSFSFPSGHATGVGTAAGVTILLVSLLVRRRSVRRTASVAAVLVALLVGLDRIFLGVHNPSDVIAGFAMGGLWVCGGALLFDPTPQAKHKQDFATPVPSSKQLAVVLNPAKVEDLDAFKTMVTSMAVEAGWSVPTWHETTVEDPGRSMAEEAAISGAEMVIVCGGDGTVRTVCAELAGTGISVGVVPAGTGNLLARNLDVPLYLQQAVDVALHGQDRAIDLVKISGDGIADDEHFMVMAGMGFDAAIMEGANEKVKAKVGWLAYVVSGLRNLMFPSLRIEMSVDGGEWTRHRARTVVIGNVGYLQAGMPLLPDAAIDDGVLDVVILHPRRFLSWIPLAIRVLSKARRVDELVDRRTGRTISLRAPNDVPRQIDGDPIGPGKEIHAEVVHGRLLVRVPR